MKVLTSRVVVFAIVSILTSFVAHAEDKVVGDGGKTGDMGEAVKSGSTPAIDYKVVTSKAYVDDEISKLAAHKVNGVAISNENNQFYAEETVRNSGSSATKTVQLSGGGMDSDATTIPTGMILVIKPGQSSTVVPTTLKLKRTSSDTTGISKSLRYNGAAITTDMAGKVWNSTNPSIWVFDGTYWNFVGGGTVADGLVDGLASHTVNGAPLSNLASTFYGSGTGADGEMKRVSISSIDSTTTDVLPPTGLIIVVQPTAGDTRGRFRLKLNSFLDAPVFYRGEPVNENNVEQVWSKKFPSTFVFDGTNWVFLGTVDTDTTYSNMSVDEGTTGQSQTQRVLTAQNLKPIIQGTTLTGVDTTATTAVTASDTVTTGIGKLQGQINDLSSHKINGMPLSGFTSNGDAVTSMYFYGTSDAAAADEVRNVTIGGITELAPGLMIIVKPTITAAYGNADAAAAAKLNLNGLGAKGMRYNGAALTTTNDGYAWKANTPGLWLYDGTYWNFAGYDANNTYSAMTDGASGSYSGPAGTATTNTVVSPKVLKNTVLDGITLTANTGRTAFDSTIANTPITASDKVIEAFGHAQGQINNKQNKIDATWIEVPALDNSDIWQLRGIATSDNSATDISATEIGLMTNNDVFAILSYNNEVHSLVDANYGFFQSIGQTDRYEELENFVPTVAAVGEAFGELRAFSWDSTKHPAAINAYSTTFSNSATNAWPVMNETKAPSGSVLANALALKQNKISSTSDGTDNTPNYVYNATTNPTADGSVVTTTTTAGTVGQRGIATAPVSDGNGGYSNGDWLPTVNAMMSQINAATETLVWDSERHPVAINTYNKVFGNGNYDWPAGTGDHLVTGSFLANALAEKQMRLPGVFDALSGNTDLRGRGNTVIRLGTAGYAIRMYTTAAGNEPLIIHRNADAVITYINGTKTLAEFQTSNFGAEDSPTVNKNNNYIKEALVSLETLKDVYSELNTKITNNALPTGTAGTVVTYNGTNAGTGVQQFTETAIYNTANAYNATNDANKLATAGFVETKQDKIDATWIEVPALDNSDIWQLRGIATSDNSATDISATEIGLMTNNDVFAILSYNNEAHSLVDANYGFFQSIGQTDRYEELENLVPTVAAVGEAFGELRAFSWDSTKHPAAIDAYSTTFSNSATNAWPVMNETKAPSGSVFANALARKQNRIATNLVSFNDTPNSVTYNVPALVSFGTGTNNADGILGNKIGIVGYGNIGADLADYDEVGMDNYVPTVYAVAAALSAIWEDMPSQWQALSWLVSGDGGANRTNAINAYNSAFGNGTNNWAGNGNHLINGYFLANSLALKQNKIDAQNTSLVPGQQVGNGVPSSVIAPTATPGVVQQVALWNADGGDPASWDLNGYTNDAAQRTAIRQSIPTVGAVEAALNSIQSLYWDSNTFPAAIDTYSTTFDPTTTHVNGNWPYLEQENLVRADTFANSLARKQNKIPAGTFVDGGNDILPGIVTTTNVPGVIGERMILDHTNTGYAQGIGEMLAHGDPEDIARVVDDIHTNDIDDTDVLASIPTTGSVIMGLNEKQNTIPTRLVSLGDEWFEDLPSVVSFDSTSGLVGNKYGILDVNGSMNYIDDGWQNYVGDSEVEYLIPTVGAVGRELHSIWDNMPAPWTPLTWNNTQSTAINAYNSTFGNSTNQWAGNSNHLINGQFLANSLALKQNVLPAKSTGNYEPRGGQTIELDTLGNPKIHYIATGWDSSTLSGGLTVKTGAPSISDYIYGEYDTDQLFTTFTNNTFGTTSGTTLARNKKYIKDALVSVSLLKDVYSDLHTYVGDAIVEDVFAHKVNGAPLSNTASYFYGEGVGEADTSIKTVSIPSITGTPAVGQVIIVKPATTNTASTIKINLNNTTAYGVLYRGSTTNIPSEAWTAYVPSIFVLDEISGGTKYWRYVGTSPSSMAWGATETNATNAYSTTFDGTTNNWPTADNNKYVKGDSLAYGLALKQNALPAQASGAPVTIPTYPAYGTSDGVIGKMYLDISSLYTANDEHFPSSKLISTTLSSYVPKSDALNTSDTNSNLAAVSGAPSWATTNGVASLYRVPGAASGSNWATTALSTWSSSKIVPTMDTLANSLAGLYDAVGDLVDNQILNYSETGSNLSGASVPVPSQIAYTGTQTLGDGNQLFWLPQLDKDGVREATRLLKSYSDEKIVPTMDELAFALDGVLQTHETTREWQEVVNFYRVSAGTLFDVAKAIGNPNDNAAVALYKSGYLQTFAPSLEALMNESSELHRLIETKQDKLSGTNGNLVTYGASAGTTGSRAIATTITNDADTVPNTVAVYNAVNARQNVIPVAGNYRSSNTATSDTPISDWAATDIRGTALVTKPTSSNGVVGERKIFEAGDTYTDNIKTNIQIATIGAVMENTFTKTCVEYAPGSTQNDTTCWLWQLTSNNVTPTRCSANGVSCSSGAECCSGVCRSGVCDAVSQFCAGEGTSCSIVSCCDGLTCDSRSSTCVRDSSRT